MYITHEFQPYLVHLLHMMLCISSWRSTGNHGATTRDFLRRSQDGTAAVQDQPRVALGNHQVVQGR